MKTFSTPVKINLTWKFSGPELVSSMIGTISCRIAYGTLYIWDSQCGGNAIAKHKVSSRAYGMKKAAQVVAERLMQQ